MLKILENVPLAPLTTIQLGGRARYFVRCRAVGELREALQWAKAKNIRWQVLGGGSNTVFLDKGFDGLVIKVELKGIEWGKDGRVSASAGGDWDPFVAECVGRNLAGVECLSGIPGCVGATPIQNVGAYGQEVSQIITQVRAIDTSSYEEVEFKNSECDFSYRWSRFKGADAGKYIITEVEFQLVPDGEPNISYEQVKAQITTSDVVTVEDVRQIVLALRKKKSMVVDAADLNTRSCGSFFENPTSLELPHSAKASRGRRGPGIPTFVEAGIERIPAAWLIEHSGFPKGFRRGGVGISQNHNLALVNYGGTTQALLTLAEDIRVAVKKKFGIELKREPIVV